MRAWRYVAWTVVAIIAIPLIALLCNTRIAPGRVWCRPLFAVVWGPSGTFHTPRGVHFGRNWASLPVSNTSRMEIYLGTWSEFRAARDEWVSGHPSWRWSRKTAPPKPPAE